MRTKLLSALLLASTAITGIASASPIVRDHRQPQPQPQPAVVVHQPQPQPQRSDRDRDHDRDRDNQWSGGVKVTARPTWMPVNYGFQVSAGNTVVPYQYGQDPYVEGIARGEWYTLDNCVEFPGAGNVRIDLSNRPIRTLELQATAGATSVNRIGVQYVDGRVVPVYTSRLLDASSPNLRIDMGPEGLQGIKAIVVYGSGNGSFRVLGA